MTCIIVYCIYLARGEVRELLENRFRKTLYFFFSIIILCMNL